MSEDISKYFENIVGYDKTKAELIPLAAVLREEQKCQALGIRVPKGILLDGEPGGKGEKLISHG